MDGGDIGGKDSGVFNGEGICLVVFRLQDDGEGGVLEEVKVGFLGARGVKLVGLLPGRKSFTRGCVEPRRSLPRRTCGTSTSATVAMPVFRSSTLVRLRRCLRFDEEVVVVVVVIVLSSAAVLS